MKKIVLLLAAALLSFGYANAGDVSVPLETKSQAQTVTLNILFSCGPNAVQFHLQNEQNSIDQLDIYIHNVDINHGGSMEYNATAWIQMIGGSGGYSEVVPCTVNANSYVDLSSIRVTPAGNYNFNIMGIPSR